MKQHHIIMYNGTKKIDYCSNTKINIGNDTSTTVISKIRKTKKNSLYTDTHMQKAKYLLTEHGVEQLSSWEVHKI